MTTTQPGRDYLKRYEDGDEGLRFQTLKYTGNFTDLEPVPDGILGDRRMRERMKTGVLERVSREDVLTAAGKTTAAGTTTAAAAPPVAEKPGKKEKVRFGQAPRNILRWFGSVFSLFGC